MLVMAIEVWPDGDGGDKISKRRDFFTQTSFKQNISFPALSFSSSRSVKPSDTFQNPNPKIGKLSRFQSLNHFNRHEPLRRQSCGRRLLPSASK
ncbi:hypothetical protein L6452_07229 [Arctium lappa]|uniref:Uncharacterized protein n=1 Tax=Arctium lappa TaxID=4217 RepID=A0ACB9ELI1_ARCLA|nr:hypothetical protein L6452_07229 [Arctium lappa]